jgi:phage tail protein X
MIGGNQRGGSHLLSGYFEYETLQGDTFDSIALDFYNDETQASTIIQANPLHRKILTFSSGVTLKIPIIEQQAADSIPPWKRG